MAGKDNTSVRQLRLITDSLTGDVYLCRTSHKDRSKIIERHKITEDVLIAAVETLCHGVGRDETSFTTIRMPSGNYRIYIREISDIEADRFCKEHFEEKERYGE